MVDVFVELLAFHLFTRRNVDDFLDRNPLDGHIREHGAVIGATLEITVVHLRKAGTPRLRDRLAAVQQ